MSVDQAKARSIFISAIENHAPEEWQKFLDEACGEDAELRGRIELLLHAHQGDDSFLDRGHRIEAATIDMPALTEKPGDAIGPYKLLQQIGEGGMGVVYMAEQTQPVERRVALKIIKPGMDTQQIIARFEAERQALAMMDHPNIAKVLDAGTTGTGRPYFVMELVKGLPITQYCDEQHLSPRQRLELFVPICQAVQHAHQKGIIHRDLKPSNILIARYDDKPVPTVIDFGVAKATSQKLTEKTMFTQYGQLVGTIDYMSPEQAKFNQLDVDTRSDIYSLGVLLYELLTGETPFDRKRLRSAAFDELLRIIREEEPPRPSDRLSSCDTLASVAANRHMEPHKLGVLVKGELDWIVMKALEKDRSRRYETANGFAMDVQRYLDDEPVMACPPSARYRLRKFMRKHRVMLTTASAFAGLLLVSTLVSGWLALEARRAERIAEEQRKEAVDQTRIATLTEWTLWGTLENVASKGREVRLLANSLQVDADLVELETDRRIGLLRLCRTLKNLPSHEVGRTIVIPGQTFEDTEIPAMTFELSGDDDPRPQELREFVTVAILAAGQQYAALLPPITHDGGRMLDCRLSPDARRIVTLGEDHTVRLWDTRTARLVAVLRKEDERVVNYGFSLDGQTVFTDDVASVARIWDTADGKYRTQIEPRPSRYPSSAKGFATSFRRGEFAESRAAVLVGNRLLTRRGLHQTQPDIPKDAVFFDGTELVFVGPVELWDTAMGRLVARLDRPETNAAHFQFAAAGKWVTAIEGGSTVAILSSEHGGLLGRLPHSPDETVASVYVSPSGRRLVTFATSKDGSGRYRFWEGGTWRETLTALPGHATWRGEFPSDDLFIGIPNESQAGVLAVDFRPNAPAPVMVPFSAPGEYSLAGDRLHVGFGKLIDTRSWRRLSPPTGERYHPDLVRFAPDGRLVFTSDPFVFDIISNNLIDARTQKVLPFERYDMHAISSRSHLPGFGWIATRLSGIYQTELLAEVRVVPSPRADIPPERLELWAQVAVRGEIGEDGEFIRWDEPTWERKRQELAALPARRPDFPFPGRVAHDRLHWLRQEYESAGEADKPLLAKQLLDRAEAAGDKAEAARWRAIVGPRVNPPQK